ncbi:MAG: hypothetical protein ACK5V3_13600 [Bdellovibrionales bacterium]
MKLSLGSMISILICVLSVFIFSGCGQDPAEDSKSDIEGSQKPEDLQERAQKSVALRERLLFEVLKVDLISEDEESLSLRINYKLNGASRFAAFSVPVKSGQLVFREMTQWLSSQEIREQTRVEFVLERIQSQGAKKVLVMGVQLRKPQSGNEKVSQNLIVLNYLENSNLISVVKQKFEYPAKTEFQKWSNENR